jgi:hypothetical protein
MRKYLICYPSLKDNSTAVWEQDIHNMSIAVFGCHIPVVLYTH